MSIQIYSLRQIVPKGLRDILIKIKKEYNNVPVYVTENGIPDDGTLDDDQRIEYLKGYMKAMLTAIKDYGCDVRGYTVWSFMDNFKWNSGYSAKGDENLSNARGAGSVMRSRRPRPLAIARLTSFPKLILLKPLLMVILMLSLGMAEAPGALTMSTKIDELATNLTHVSNDHSTDSNRAAIDSNVEISSKQSLERFSAPDIFENDVDAADSNTVETHVRVKRISDALDHPSEKFPIRPIRISARPSSDQHRMSARQAKKVSLGQTNPADENESDYSNAYVDVDADVPGDFLNDELTRKRNHFEDVYPEVTDAPIRTEVLGSFAKLMALCFYVIFETLSNISSVTYKYRNRGVDFMRNLLLQNSKFLSSPQESSTLYIIDDDERARKKRDRGDEEIDDADADTDCIEGDQNVDYYYEDQELSGRVNCKGGKRPRESILPQAEYSSDKKQKIEKRSSSNQKSTVNKKVQHPHPQQINVQFTLSQEPKVSRHTASQQIHSHKGSGQSHTSAAKLKKDSKKKVPEKGRMKGKVKTKKITVPSKKSKSGTQPQSKKNHPVKNGTSEKGMQ
ncbi:hypothetical protein QAD02_008633 [Eretmocerus hayati]|uniref:Uncharacterized protein n=1 Tax=Eretmocerus hayati TaxID=131215 RepID=A0ACC2N8D9_9HYME|nr:hypothetical protein QAD02_008633 [Eretmocerus hayati]